MTPAPPRSELASLQALRGHPAVIKNPVRRWLRDVLLRLVGRLQGHPAWPYPLAAIQGLDDVKGRVYVWRLHRVSPDIEDDRALAAQIAEDLEESIQERFGRKSRALHIVTPDVAELLRVGREEARALVLPHLQEDDEGST